MENFFGSLLYIIGEMSPYLLLGFLVAGVLHVVVPKRFYANYLSDNSFKSVLMSALLGIPLPLCSCGVIPTAVGLRNERASRGAVASFLIATPQTGIDSIIATFSLMGLAFAIVRPVAALITGICGGMLVNALMRQTVNIEADSCSVSTIKKSDNPIIAILRYAFVEMMQNIGPRLLIGLLLAALIQVGVPDSFFLQYGDKPLLQMLVMLIVAIPMYICSTGSIPIAAALLAKGLTPGAAFVLLMAGPAVNLGSFLVIKKTMGLKFTIIYISTIILGAVGFGFLLNNFEGLLQFTDAANRHCCSSETEPMSWFKIVCSIVLIVCLLNVFIMNIFNKFKRNKVAVSGTIYKVGGMECNHCKAAVETAISNIDGIKSVTADITNQTVVIEGEVAENDIRQAVENAGFKFKGRV